MPRVAWFIISVIALLLGYLIYSRIVDRIFGCQPDRKTPVYSKKDGVDYVEMPTWRLWLIQLLNIAGVGPVFGPIMGALYGPTALLWVVLGCIFAGAVHDYFSGMLSVRYGGANVPEIVGINLGNTARWVLRIFTVVALPLAGVVFAIAPAGLLSKFTDGFMSYNVWLCLIFLYYFLATLLPIDKIIGRFYPIFGALLLFMAIGMIIALLAQESGSFYRWAEWGVNQHPKELPLWPLLFITISCGALSGFHSTQSPLIARCLNNEKNGRMIFYGAMITEGFIGLVWVTVGMTFYPDAASLMKSIAAGTPTNVVWESSRALLGETGAILTILGVVALPVTSGDTAFRAARLTIAEMLHLDQVKRLNRLYIAVPVFAVGILLSQVDFNIIWRYFGWSNQVLASMMLWSGAAYLARRNKFHWICSIPATFISAAAASYIIYEPTMGFGISVVTSNIIGAVIAVVCLASIVLFAKKPLPGDDLSV